MPRAIPDDLRYVDLEAPAFESTPLTADEQAAIDTVNRRVAEAAHISDVMDELFDSTLRICACERMALGLLLEDGGRVVLRWVKAAYEPIHITVGHGEDTRGTPLEEVVSGSRCLIIPDLRRYAKNHPDDERAQLLVAEEIRSCLVTPLLVGEDVIGLLFRESKVLGAFGDHQLRLHRAVADPLARAVRIAGQIEALEAANHAYTEMLGFVSHELRNPVASIVTDTRVLLDGFLGSLTDPQRKQLQRVTRKGEYLLDLIKEYLDLARVEEGGARLNLRRGVDFIAEVVRPAVDMAQSSLTQAGMELIPFYPDTAVGVECDASMLRIVLSNLLDNAVKYGRPGGTIRLHVNRLITKLDVSVWNEGPGFPENERQNLFRRFSRLRTPELSKRKGTGVGLYSSWRIVQLHNGRMQARSREGEWAEFSFKIPQPVGSAQLRPRRGL